MYYILLDEAQLPGELESVLNGFMGLPNVDVYVTGSNAKFLPKDIMKEANAMIFYAAGKIVKRQKLPILNPVGNFSDRRSICSGNGQRNDNSGMVHPMRGGMTNVCILRSDAK